MQNIVTKSIHHRSIIVMILGLGKTLKHFLTEVNSHSSSYKKHITVIYFLFLKYFTSFKRIHKVIQNLKLPLGKR